MPAILLALFITAAAAPAADEWLGFRGNNGSGVAEATGLPTELGPKKNVAWKVDVPFGRSSPVVTRDRIFLTASEGEKLATIALDRRTGKLLWRRDVQRARQMPIFKGNDPAAPSPASDGTNVYVFFAELGLISYAPDGTERWRLPLGPFNSFYGMGGSPIVAGGTVVLVCDHRGGSFIVAADARDGRIKWRTDRGNSAESYTTPIVYRPANGPEQVIVFGSEVLDAYALGSGERLWWVRQVGSYPVGMPALGSDMVHVSAQGADQPFLPPWEDNLKQYDANKDGRLHREEVRTHAEAYEHFGWIDTNSDLYIDKAEYEFMRGSTSRGYGVVGVRLGGAKGDVTASHTAWRVPKQFPYIPSPLVYDGVLYTVKDGGIVMSIEPKTGEVKKTGRLEGALDPYFSSPVAADGKIFMVSAQGKLTVLRAGAQWEILAVNDLGEEVWATPAIAGGRIYVRTRTALYAFGAETGTASR